MLLLLLQLQLQLLMDRFHQLLLMRCCSNTCCITRRIASMMIRKRQSCTLRYHVKRMFFLSHEKMVRHTCAV